MKNTQLVIFDMDGLMLDTERRYFEASTKKMQRLGVTVNDRVLLESIGSLNFDEQKYFVDIPEGVDASAELDRVVPDEIEHMCQNGVPVKKGLYELLDGLKQRGIRRVVATSTAIKYSGRLLKAAGVFDEFEFVLTRAEVKHGKPAPDIFLKACERAGVGIENALVLEDSDNGGRAAAAAGIKYIIVPDIKQPAEDVKSGAYAVVDSLLDVLDFWN